MNITVTITTLASGPFQISKLLAGNNYAGAVTIAPATPANAPKFPDYISIQADPANSTNFVVVGDKNILSAGNPAGKRLAAGVSDVRQGPAVKQQLSQLFVQGSASGVIVNIEVYGQE